MSRLKQFDFNTFLIIQQDLFPRKQAYSYLVNRQRSRMSLKDVQYVRSALERCILAIKDWCSSRRLQLNPDKT